MAAEGVSFLQGCGLLMATPQMAAHAPGGGTTYMNVLAALCRLRGFKKNTWSWEGKVGVGRGRNWKGWSKRWIWTKIYEFIKFSSSKFFLMRKENFKWYILENIQQKSCTWAIRLRLNIGKITRWRNKDIKRDMKHRRQMASIHPILSVTTFNVHGLNFPISIPLATYVSFTRDILNIVKYCVRSFCQEQIIFITVVPQDIIQ